MVFDTLKFALGFVYGRLNHATRVNDKSVINQVSIFMKQTEGEKKLSQESYQYQDPKKFAPPDAQPPMQPIDPVPPPTDYAPDYALPQQPYAPPMDPYYSRGHAMGGYAHSLDQYSTYNAYNAPVDPAESALQPQVISRGFVPKRKKRYPPPAPQPQPEEFQYYMQTNPAEAQAQAPDSGEPPFPQVLWYKQAQPGGYYPYQYYNPYPYQEYLYAQRYPNTMYAYQAGYQQPIGTGGGPAQPVMPYMYNETGPTPVKQTQQKTDPKKKEWKSAREMTRERSNSDAGSEAKKEDDQLLKHMSCTDCSIDSFSSLNSDNRALDDNEEEKTIVQLSKLSMGSSSENKAKPSPRLEAKAETHNKGSGQGKRGKKQKHEQKIVWVPKKQIQTEEPEEHTSKKGTKKTSKSGRRFLERVGDARDMTMRGEATENETLLTEGQRTYKGAITTPRRKDDSHHPN